MEEKNEDTQQARKNLIRDISRKILFEEDPARARNALLCAFYALEEIATFPSSDPEGHQQVAIEAFETMWTYFS